MKIQYYLLTLFLGVILTVHLAMNGKVGSVINNPRVGNALFWCIGAAEVGAGPLMIMLLAGQIVGGLLLSHFGWLGSPVDRITLSKLAGVILMIGGVVLATFKK